MKNDERKKQLLDAACQLAITKLGAPATPFLKERFRPIERPVENRVSKEEVQLILETLKARHTAPTLQDVLDEVQEEVASAEAKWPAMNSAHEAYGVLMEEIRELEEHIFTNQKRRNMAEMRAEAIQVAAMAVRLVRDICDGNRGHK